MASDNGSLVTTLALSDIIHTHSPSPAPQAPPDVRPQDASVLPRFDGQSLIHDVPQAQSNGSILTPPQDIIRAQSPEPLTAEDASKFRSRLVEMGLSTDGTRKKSEGLNISSREEELLDMVLVLTRSPFISSEQLVTQANMISALQTQRDHLLAEIREERSRMEAERDGWGRSAEALIAQRNKPGSGATPSEELERKCSTLESDNRILKDRLQDAHNRASALEAEIIKLKPMLLMLPSSHSTGAGNGLSGVKGKGKKRKQQTPPNEDYQDREQTPDLSKRLSVGARIIPTDMSFSSITSTASHNSATNSSSNAVASTMVASTSTTPSNRSDLYRFPYSYAYPYSLMSSPANQPQQAQSTPQGAKNVNPYLSYALSTRINGHPSTGPATSSPGASSSSAAPHGSSSKSTKPNAATTKSKRRSSTSILQSLTSDARTEHILLASRKVGRERAALLAGLMQQAEKEKLKYQEAGRAAKESEKLERERMRIGGGGMYYRNNSNVPGEPSTPKRGTGGASGGGATSQQQQQQAHHTQYHKPQRTSTFVYVTPGHSNSAGAQVSTQPQPPAQVQPAPSSTLVPLGTPGEQIARSATPVQRTPRQQHATLPPNNSNTNAGNTTTITPALPQTPSQPVQQQGVMQTPLDSLLSAARSLMSDDEENDSSQAGGRQGAGGESGDHLPVGGVSAKGKGRATGANGNGTGGRRRGAAALEEPESPLPKRRRTNASGASVSTTGGVGGATSTRRSSSTARQARVPSALDVLADQAQVAAALPSQSSSQHPQHNTSNARAETMTTASLSSVQNEDDHEEAVISKRRVSTRRKGKGKAKESLGEVEEVKPRDVGPASDGESEVEPVDGDDNGETVLPTPPPAPPPPRKRGRPRKDKSAAAGSAAPKPADANDPVKEESGSVSGRRRVAGRGRAAALALTNTSSSASTSIIRARGMKESTQADGSRETPVSTNTGKRGKGSKTRNHQPARTTATPVPTSMSPSAPRIIAPPPEPAVDLDHSPQQRTPTPSPPPLEEDEKVSDDKEAPREGGSPEQSPQPQPRGSSPVAGETKDADAEEEDRRAQEDGDIAGSRDPSDTQSVDGTQERGSSRAVDPGGSPGAGVGGAADVAVEGEDLAPNADSQVGAGDVIMDVESEEVEHPKGSPPPTSTKSEVDVDVDVEMEDAASQPAASSTSVENYTSSQSLDQPPASPTLQDEPSPNSTLLSSLHQEHGSVLPEGPGQTPPRESTPSATVPDASAATEPIKISEEISTLNSSCGAPPDDVEGAINAIAEIAAAPATGEERGHSPPNASISVESNSISNGMFNKENADHDSDIDAEHDADMDAEADEDLDAEGEYEDEREGDGAQSVWSHVAFSSSDISNLLQGADEEGEDADAEGEIEDELDEPSSSTVFYPSQLD